jgi:hypothetical protein
MWQTVFTQARNGVIGKQVTVSGHEGSTVKLTRYVICRTDASPCGGWYWAGCGCWTNAVDHARLFECLTDAELIGFVECPLPLELWDVVPVAPSVDHLGARPSNARTGS